MANEVEIVVTSKDKTAPGLASAKASAKTAGREAGEEFVKESTGRVRDSNGRFLKVGGDAGTSIGDGIGRSGAGERAGHRFGTGLTGSILGGLGKMAGKVASASGDALSSAFGKVAKNPYVAGAVLTAVSASLIGGMPAVGAAAAGALVLGFGAGIAGIGIVAAAQNEKVSQSFSQLKDYVGRVAKQLATPFIPVLLNISTMARTTFNSFIPSLRDAFSRMAPFVQGFAANMTAGFGQLRSSIGPVTTAFNSLLASIGPQLPGLFAELSAAITNVADSISANPQTFTNLVTWTFQLATGLTNLIAKLSEGANWYQRHSTAAAAMFTVATAGVGPLTAQALGIGKTTEATKESSRAFADTTTAMQGAATAAQWLSTHLDALNQRNQSAEQANLRYEESIDRVRQSILANGVTLDANTDKGRANRQAILNSAQAAIAFRDAQVAQKVPLDIANEKLDEQRRRLINTAVQAGMSRKAARAYIDTLLAVPPSRTTTFKNNAPAAKQEIINMGNVIKRLPSGKVFTFQVRTVITGPPAARRAFSTGGSGGFQHEGGGGGSSMRATGGIIGAAAGGGPRSNMTWVGEHGPELVDIPTGSMVRSNPDSRRIATGGGSAGGPIHITLNIGGQRLGDLILDPLRKTVHSLGGNVQAVLGR